MDRTTSIRGGGLHVAIIMDGNGRWAEARGLPRTAGHRGGATAVRRVVEAAPSLDIDVRTPSAFSSANRKRPDWEIGALMRRLETFLRTEAASCVEQSVRVEVLGRRDRLPVRVRDAIASVEQATAAGTVLRLRLAIDDSSRDAIVRAAARAPRSRAELARSLASDVDLLIGTGGEQRLSDFLLWERAYAERRFGGLEPLARPVAVAS